MRVWLIISLVTIFSGCTLFNVTTTISDPGLNTWVVESKSDSRVVIEKEGVKIEVDNRGRPGMVEQMTAAVITNLPDVETE